MATACVYLMRCGSYHKIGFSINPQTRRASVRLPDEIDAGDEPIVVVHSFPCHWPRLVEAALHRKYAKQRIGGEWFLLDEKDVQFICCILSWDDHDGPPNTTVPVEYTPPPGSTPSTSFHLSAETRAQLDELAAWYKVSLAGAVQLAIGALHHNGPPTVSKEAVQAILEALPESMKTSGQPGKRRPGRPRKPTRPKKA